MKNSEIQKINRIQNEINQEIKGKKLHILNGECMLNCFRSNRMINEEDEYISWNEAMCWGDVDEIIFSTAFIEKRILSLKTTKKDYQKIVLESLRPLFEYKGSCIVCWFGNDMFCQMNLLTILAYLKQINYQGKVIGCIFDEKDIDNTIDYQEIDIQEAFSHYYKTMCQKERINSFILEEMKKATSLYLTYELEESAINQAILKNIDKKETELIQYIMNNFTQYGLGDIQIQELIQRIKEKNQKINKQ